MKRTPKEARSRKKISITGAILSIVFLGCILSFYFIYASDMINADRQQDVCTNNTAAIGLKNGGELKQVIANYPGKALSAIGICMGTYARTNQGIMQVSLYSDETLVDSWRVSSSTLVDNQYEDFQLKTPLKMKEGVEYSISIKERFKGDNTVAIWTNGDDSTGFTLNGREQAGSICYIYFYNLKPLIGYAFIPPLVILGCIIILAGLKANEQTVMSVILAILLIIYLCALPLGTVPDEFLHFCRAYEIANGGMISRHFNETNSAGDVLPSALYNYMDSSSEIDWNETEEIDFSGAALYSPLTYLPQAIGIRIASLFTKNVSAVYHAGIYASTALCFIICAAALCLMPFGRKALFVVLLFPMTLQEIASISPDGMTISLSMFLLAYIAHLKYKADRVKGRDAVILFVAGIILAMCKIVYVVLLFLVFLVPDSKFSSKKNALLFKLSLIGTAGIMNLIWLRISASLLVAPNAGANGRQQVIYVLTHLPDYYATVVRTIIYRAYDWVNFMVGSLLGALNIPTAPIVPLGFVCLFLITLCNSDAENCAVGKHDAAIYMLVFLAGSALVVTSLYVQWTAVGANIIAGIQGRYFTPLMGVLTYFVISMKNAPAAPRVPARNRTGSLYFYSIILCLNGIALWDIVNRFYFT